VTAARRTDREARRAQLVSAAVEVFAEKGVAATAVSDIVKAAGVAQGTFYLYFASKTDVINAVADELVDEMVAGVERSLAGTSGGAVARLLALRDALSATARSEAGRELVEAYHLPENREVHHEMGERVAPRLASIVASIVEQGVAEGVFVTEDVAIASWFVLGGLQGLEFASTSAEDMPAAIAQVTVLALRALGYAGPVPTESR
jgi:TetR/AcrR family transcriptional regulator, fatty acid metabolism regulator protein